MHLYEVTNLKTQNILTESWNGLNENQQMFLGKAEQELWPLLEQLTKVFEAELTQDQITAIFKSAEANAMASGKHKSALGKAGQIAKLPVDLMKKVNDKVNELGRMAQNAGPVKDMDKKFAELTNKIGKQDNKITQGIKAVSDWAKANPGKATLAVAILTAVAAFATGPAGGAAAGFLLRSTKDLLKGEKLSTAVGKAAKTAAIGALAGATFDAIGDNVVSNIEADGQDAIDATAEAMKTATQADAMAEVSAEYGDVIPQLKDGYTNLKMSGSINNYNFSFDVVLTGPELEQYNELSNAVKSAGGGLSDETLQATAKLHDFLGSVQASDSQETLRGAAEALKKVKELDYTPEQLEELIGQINDLEGFVASAEQNVDGAAAAIQAGGQQADELKKNAVRATAPKTESIDYETYLHQRLKEAPAQQSLAQKAKAGLGKLAGKVGGAIKKGATELGNNVTFNKLMKAWKAVGSPTDTGSIMNLLGDAGLDNNEISAIGTAAKVDLKGQPTQQQAPTQAQPQQQAPAQQEPADAGDLDSIAKQIQASGQSDLIKAYLQLSAAGVTGKQLMADVNETELNEGLKDWARNLAMAGVIVAGLAGINSINDAIDRSVPAVQAIETALEMAQDAGNDELAKMIEKDLSAVKIRLSSGKDLNFVKGMQDKYSKFVKTEGLAYESKLAIILNQQLK